MVRDTQVKLSRRGLITGAAALLAMPAIVQFDSIMRVRAHPVAHTLSCWIKRGENGVWQRIEKTVYVYPDGKQEFNINMLLNEGDVLNIPHLIYGPQLEFRKAT